MKYEVVKGGQTNSIREAGGGPLGGGGWPSGGGGWTPRKINTSTYEQRLNIPYPYRGEAPWQRSGSGRPGQ